MKTISTFVPEREDGVKLTLWDHRQNGANLQIRIATRKVTETSRNLPKCPQFGFRPPCWNADSADHRTQLGNENNKEQMLCVQQKGNAIWTLEPRIYDTVSPIASESPFFMSWMKAKLLRPPTSFFELARRSSRCMLSPL